MNKFAVFSGFLGSGKTTAMMALSKYYSEHYGKAAMISNDLGHQSLADNKFAQLSGCNASEMTDECICYQHENLVARLDSLFQEEGCDLVFSDIPGFGVGALEHVYHGLSEEYPGRYELAPFTVLIEPKTAKQLRAGRGGDLEYILETQLAEADLLVLNKCDLLDPQEEEELVRWLEDHCPEARVIRISALTGRGMDDLAKALRDGTASMRRPDIGYGGPAFGAAMGRISEYYIQYHAAVCCNDFDGNAYLKELADAIAKGITAQGAEIPHAKILAWEPEGDFGKADLIGTDRETVLTRSFSAPCTELAVMINASAVCEEKELDEIITSAVHEVSDRFQLETQTFKKECFDMSE